MNESTDRVRTSFALSRALWVAAKTEALHQGMTLGELIEESLRDLLVKMNRLNPPTGTM